MSVTTQNTAVSGWATVLSAQKETAFGVAPGSGTGTIYLPFQQSQITTTNKLISRNPVRRSKSEMIPGFGLVAVTGSIDTHVDPDSIGLLLGLALGSDTVVAGAGGAAGSYTHTFKLGAQSTAVMQADFGKNSVAQFLGSKFSGMDLSCKPGEDLTAKFQFMGQTVNLLASQSLSPTYTNNSFFEWGYISPVTVDGSTVDITDFNVSVKNDNKPMYTSTSGRLARGFNELGSAVTGTFIYPYKDDTINALVWGGNSGPASAVAATGHTLIIPFTHPAVAGGTAKCAITITLNNVVFEDAPIPVQAKGEVMQQVKFRAAETTAGASDAISIALVNSATAAYV